jgi:hypothetical protein
MGRPESAAPKRARATVALDSGHRSELIVCNLYRLTRGQEAIRVAVMFWIAEWSRDCCAMRALVLSEESPQAR